MLAVDIREVNRLRNNAKRIAKAISLIQLANKTNRVSDLDLNWIELKLVKAQNAMEGVANDICKRG